MLRLGRYERRIVWIYPNGFLCLYNLFLAHTFVRCIHPCNSSYIASKPFIVFANTTALQVFIKIIIKAHSISVIHKCNTKLVAGVNRCNALVCPIAFGGCIFNHQYRAVHKIRFYAFPLPRYARGCACHFVYSFNVYHNKSNYIQLIYSLCREEVTYTASRLLDFLLDVLKFRLAPRCIDARVNLHIAR